MQFYTVHHINQYVFKLARVNIEDVAGEVVDDSSRRELTANCRRFWQFDQDEGDAYLRRDALIADLVCLHEEAVKNGKTSFTVSEEQLEVLIHHSMSEFMPNARRNGNTVRMYAPRPVDLTKPKVQDFHKLIERAGWAISSKYDLANGSGFEVKIKYAINNKKGAVDMVKKLISIEEIVEHCNRQKATWKHVSDDDRAKLQKIWDNPDTFNSKKSVDQTA